MASSGKKKTTMAKIMREARLRERRAAKQARKDARKLPTPHDTELPPGTALGDTAEPTHTNALADTAEPTHTNALADTAEPTHTNAP